MSKTQDNPITDVLSGATGMVTDWDRKQHRRLVAEHIRRECEALRLYEPLPYQDEFHQCKAQQALILKGNRTGGSVALMVEVARAFTGQDPYRKYPKTDGRIIVLGYGEKHIGRVFYEKLFRPGAFRILRDQQTGKWRVYRPWPASEGGDLERFSESFKAPPLIPQRFLDGKISWEKRSERVFSLANSTTGWELHATNSAGDPGQAQGISVNLYAIDEDTATPGWHEEAVGRVADCGGFIRWAALPHAKNNDLMSLVKLAKEQADKPNPVAVIVRASIYDNKYIPKESVERSVASWKSKGEDVYRKRALGEININSTLMYPTFSRHVHDVMNVTESSTEAQKILAERMGEPPDDWTRYASIDPGYTALAIEFIAVPPPELGDQIFLYDESFIREPPVPSEAFGDAMHMKCGDRVMEAFFFDMHGGRLRSISSGEVPVDKYRQALESRSIKSASLGYGFRHACDDRKRREEELRTLLAIQRNGQPRLMVVVGKCSVFCAEMEGFKKKTVKQMGVDIPLDEGDRRVNTHAIECYDEQTEVLSRSGWKLFRDVLLDDELATVDLETNQIEYQIPLALISKPYSGEMIRFGGLKMDALVTPKHRMVIEKDVGPTGRGPATVREAGDLNKWVDAIKLTAEWSGVNPECVTLPRMLVAQGNHANRIALEKELNPEDFAEFMGWYLAEGCCGKRRGKRGVDWRVTISQNDGWKRVLLLALLEKLPWKWGQSGKNITCSCPQLCTYLRQFGYSHEKFIPQWIKDGSQEIIRRFLTGAVLGDGWLRGSYRGRCYASCSKRLVDDVQELFLKLGKWSSVLDISTSRSGCVRGRLVTPTRPFYQTSECMAPNAILRNSAGKPNFDPVQYDGMVYCATVPNSTLIVRRNGKPLVCGNCVEGAIAMELAYVKPRHKAAQFDLFSRWQSFKDKMRRRRQYDGAGSDHISLGPLGVS